MVCHLATRGVTACNSHARFPVRSTILEDVTCTHCWFRIELGRRVVAERKEEDARRELCESVGLGEFYARIDPQKSATCEMLRNLVFALAKYMVERDYLDETSVFPLALADPSP